MQPTIRIAALAKVVDQFGVARLDRELVEIHRHGVITRQAAEKPLRHLAPGLVEHIEPDRQRGLRHRHRRRLHDAAEAFSWQHLGNGNR